MKVNRKQLLSVLTAVKPGLASKEVIEHSSSFIFTPTQVMTYNDEVSISHPIEDTGIEGAVPSKEFFNLINKISDEEIEITQTESEVIVKGKKTKSGIKLFVADNITDIISAISQKKKWSDVPEGFVEAVTFCIPSVGRDLSRPILLSVHCGDSQIASSDGFRMSVCTIDASLPTMNIPAAALKDMKTFNPTDYALAGGWVHFKNANDVVYSARVTDGEYPIVRMNQIVNSVDGEPTKLPAGLHDCLDRAGIFTGNSGNNSDTVTFTFESGVVTVKGESDAGWIEETHRVRYAGEPLKFNVNPSFLDAIISHTDEVTIGGKLLKFENEGFVHIVSTVA